MYLGHITVSGTEYELDKYLFDFMCRRWQGVQYLSDIKGLIRLYSKQRELHGKRDYQQHIILQRQILAFQNAPSQPKVVLDFCLTTGSKFVIADFSKV